MPPRTINTTISPCLPTQRTPSAPSSCLPSTGAPLKEKPLSPSRVCPYMRRLIKGLLIIMRIPSGMRIRTFPFWEIRPCRSPLLHIKRQIGPLVMSIQRRLPTAYRASMWPPLTPSAMNRPSLLRSTLLTMLTTTLGTPSTSCRPLLTATGTWPMSNTQ